MSTEQVAVLGPQRPRSVAIARPLRKVLTFCRQRPLGAIGAFIVIVISLACALAPVIAPHNPNTVNSLDLLQGPSGTYWFGTDNLGRDVFSRVLWGGRISLMVGLIAVLISTALAVTVGTISGYCGGWVDLAVQRIVDAMLAFPGLVLMLTIMTVLSPGLWSVAATIGVLSAVGYSRIVRSVVLSVKSQPYIDAAKIVGCSETRIVIRHIMPNMASSVIVVASIGLAAAILIESSLSFLGFGVPPPDPTWGEMLGGNARPYLFEAPWMAIWPGVALSATVFGFNMLGDAIRDALDPRLRRR